MKLHQVQLQTNHKKDTEINFYNKDIISKYDIQYANDSISKRKDSLLIDILDTRGVVEVKKAYKGLRNVAKEITTNLIFNFVFELDNIAEALYENSDLRHKIVEFIKHT